MLDMLDQTEDVYQGIIENYTMEQGYNWIRRLRNTCAFMHSRVDKVMCTLASRKLTRFIKCERPDLVINWLLSDTACGKWARAHEYLDLLHSVSQCGLIAGKAAWLMETLSTAKCTEDFPSYHNSYPDKIDVWMESHMAGIDLEDIITGKKERSESAKLERYRDKFDQDSQYSPRNEIYTFKWHKVYANSQPSVMEVIVSIEPNLALLKPGMVKEITAIWDRTLCKCTTMGESIMCADCAKRCVLHTGNLAQVNLYDYSNTTWITDYPHASMPLSIECVALRRPDKSGKVTVERLCGHAKPKKLTIRLHGLVRRCYAKPDVLYLFAQHTTAVFAAEYIQMLDMHYMDVIWPKMVCALMGDIPLESHKKITKQLDKRIANAANSWLNSHLGLYF